MCPRGLVKFVETIYEQNRAFYGCGPEAECLFTIVSGILQGCPGSGTFFVIAIEPFINKFSAWLLANDAQRTPMRTGAPDELKACADDLAFAIFRLSSLVHIKAIFDEALRLSKLALKPRKCIIVPARRVLPPEQIVLLREWLAGAVPVWESFQILPAATYLGFYLGPGAGESRWQNVLAKYNERTRAITAIGAPPAVSARLYASRAAPTLSYLWQLLPVPSVLRRWETFRLHALLHIPQNSFSYNALFALHEAGGPKIPSIAATAFAASVRTATVTLPEWREKIVEMRRWALDEAEALSGP